MTVDDAIEALSPQALKMIKNNFVIGLGSGRAATAIVRLLSSHIKKTKFSVKAIPTSLQIKMEAERGQIPLIEADQINHIDLVFDGADQIDASGNMIKGGGGALLREKILISIADKVVIIADESKFVKKLNRSVPVEVHPFARKITESQIRKIGGNPHIRLLDRGYPFMTENGNVILDCDFGQIRNPKELATKIIEIPGVIEVGIFSKPDIIYKVKENGKYEIV
ncbi:Ribose 5-phosphate isomerase [Nitrosotalea sinensis]|uniref:Ribose 5-phosphate isomerase A n=1 Tax=Nitrosotalea sinensis TaxID=1499975 RepID=A0A2H1EGP1_9ARCH|nr:ribose-5-phosphate isomerase RpiA [Candidatus Nitrosotalea sinensis]SHO44290.1 Ribose 5-phosphate isomerase [Candidatus Nitrosotalea sinensis]